MSEDAAETVLRVVAVVVFGCFAAGTLVALYGFTRFVIHYAV